MTAPSAEVVWVTDDKTYTVCESCGCLTRGHEVTFADGERFKVCSACVPLREITLW